MKAELEALIKAAVKNGEVGVTELRKTVDGMLKEASTNPPKGIAIHEVKGSTPTAKKFFKAAK